MTRPFRLRAVLFDFDGTLTHPGALDFPAIKRELGCPPQEFVLEWIRALPLGAARDAAEAALERFELAAADASSPNEGVEELVRSLKQTGLAVGILTRNGMAAVERALRRFAALTTADFDVIVTRDDEIALKPAPDGVLHAAAAMGASPAETLVVGDYLLDMKAGRAAGAITAYLAHSGTPDVSDAPVGGSQPVATDCDFVVGSLAELEAVIRLGLPLIPGKLPNELLAGFLSSVAEDPALLVAPRVGEDVTAIDLGKAEVLVAHGDPITLGGRALGSSAVLVNANDIAAAGADPRWMLTTVLLPTGTTPSEALAVLSDLSTAAAEAGITLAGGHTEITTAVGRVVISLTMFGTLERAELKDKRSARSGDRVLLTKALAPEGAALLAEELGERLRSLGMKPRELAACLALREQASIVPEARIARDLPGVHAMHDVTEGGLATALRELASATGLTILVRRDRVPVSPETTRICALLGADPLGLIASGSLLICCDSSQAALLTERLTAAAIPVTDIGELTEKVGCPAAAESTDKEAAGGADKIRPDAGEAGVVALERDRPVPWPSFATDEAARLLADRAPKAPSG